MKKAIGSCIAVTILYALCIWFIYSDVKPNVDQKSIVVVLYFLLLYVVYMGTIIFNNEDK